MNDEAHDQDSAMSATVVSAVALRRSRFGSCVQHLLEVFGIQSLTTLADPRMKDENFCERQIPDYPSRR